MPDFANAPARHRLASLQWAYSRLVVQSRILAAVLVENVNRFGYCDVREKDGSVWRVVPELPDSVN